MPPDSQPARGDGDGQRVVQVPFELSSVGVARRLLAGDLFTQGVAHGVVDDAVLVLSELVTNSVQHGLPQAGHLLEVSWRLEPDRLRLSVHEGGRPTRLTPQPSSAVELGGRGLFIVDHLSEAWQVDYDDGLKVTSVIRTEARSEDEPVAS